MFNAPTGYQRVLVATDFSLYADAATRLGMWVADQSHATLTLAHVAPSSHRVADSPYRAQHESFYGGIEDLDQRIREISDERLKRLLAELRRPTTRRETMVGEPFVEVIRAVQQEGYDLVMMGTRGVSAWKQFLIGSMAQRLIRKCPATVWAVKAEHADPPRAVLAATDFSEVSQRAVVEGLWVARQASAEFHLMHSIDYRNDDLLNSFDQPATLFPVEPLRRDIQAAAQKRLEAIAESLALDGVKLHLHVVWGTSWQEVGRLAQQFNIDLVALGTVGRSGIKGVFLGNTAERILTTCDCSILAVKPADFVSPIRPADRPPHPTTESI